MNRDISPESQAIWRDVEKAAKRSEIAQQGDERESAELIPADVRADISADPAYVWGLKAGWNFAVAGDRAGLNAGIQRKWAEISAAKRESASLTVTHAPDHIGDSNEMVGESAEPSDTAILDKLINDPAMYGFNDDELSALVKFLAAMRKERP